MMILRTQPCCSTAPRRVLQIAAISLLTLLVLCTAAYALSTVWTRMVDGSAHADDRAESIALAPNGDLYAVGYRSNTGESRDIWVRKYDPNGTTKWTRVVGGSANAYDAAHEVAVDAAGNLFVVGYISPTGGSPRIWIRKYNSSGAKLWTRTVDGLAGSAAAHGAAVDPTGNLYVVGYTFTSTRQEDIWIRKYSSSGTKLWTRIVPGDGASFDSATGAAVDGSGNLYVVGTIYKAAGLNNIWIRKYAPSGAKLWTRIVTGTGNAWDTAEGAAVDSDDNLFVVGSIYVSGENYNIWIRKYSPSGAKLWTRRFNGSANGSDQASAVATDANGAAYVIGEKALIGSKVIWIRKYSSAGVKRWTTTFGGPVDFAHGRGITVNDTKRVYAVGSVHRPPNADDIWVRKYSQ